MTSSWLKEFDPKQMGRSIDFRLLLLEEAARQGGEPHGDLLKTRGQLELEHLERQAAKRELCRRADAGDLGAVEQLVRGRAETELLLDELRAVAHA